MARTPADQLPRISNDIFAGGPVPPPYTFLWDAMDDGYPVFDCILADSTAELAPLLEGYAPREDDDAGQRANLAAHTQVWAGLSFFFHHRDEDAWWAWPRGVAEDGPVVQLDSEGQYEYVGATLADALLRACIDAGEDEDETRAWLSEHGFADPGPLGVSGGSTQFLPNLRELHVELDRAARGLAAPPRAASSAPVRVDEPETWIDQPGEAIAAALAARLGPDALRARHWVGCDGRGRVRTVFGVAHPGLPDASLRGIRIGATVAEVEAQLGAPTHRSDEHLSYELGNGVLATFELAHGRVTDLSPFVP